MMITAYLQRAALSLTLCATLLVPGVAHAETPARLDILPGHRDTAGIRHAGVRIRLEPGWKTYWRSPGDGGIAPEFDFSASTNLKSFAPDFPSPIVFSSGGITTPGYSDTVVLPLRLVPTDPSAPIQLRGTLSLGVCRDVCLPMTLGVDIELSGKGAPDPQIAAARAAAPEKLTARATCRFKPISDGMRVTATLPFELTGDAVPLLEFSDPDIWVSQPRRQTGGDIVADLVPPSGAPFAIDRSALRFTVIDRGRAVELTGCLPG